MCSSIKASSSINDSNQPTQVRGVRRAVYLSLAIGFLGLGLLGVVLPGLPTTPFLLLTSYLLIRSSPRLHQRVVRMPVVGRSLRDWDEHRGVRRHVKWIAYTMVIGVVGLSLFSQVLSTPIKVAIVLLASVGVFVVWRLPVID